MAAHLRGNAVAYVVLFFVLAGGTAAALPGRNSVGSDDIRRGVVRSSDIHDGGIRRADLATGAQPSVQELGVIETPRSLIDAPEGGATVQKSILTFGPFEVFGNCRDNVGVSVNVKSSQPAHFLIGTIQAINGQNRLPGGGGQSALFPGTPILNHNVTASRGTTLVSETGRAMQLGVFLANVGGAGGDCMFQASGLGR